MWQGRERKRESTFTEKYRLEREVVRSSLTQTPVSKQIVLPVIFNQRHLQNDSIEASYKQQVGDPELLSSNIDQDFPQVFKNS